MPAKTDAKAKVQQALEAFEAVGLPQAAIGLWAALGYKSDKTLDLPNTPDAFLQDLEVALPDEKKVNQDKARVAEWQAAHFLFQLTNDEIPSLAYGQTAISIGEGGYERGRIESFVFLAVKLTPRTSDDKEWTRSSLAAITRELNRAFPMPVIVLFHYAKHISIAVIDRRANKRNASRDVLDNRRISIIKDVRCENPHRAHVEILNDLLFANLGERYRPSNFRDLYDNWLSALSVQELNKRFYNELLHWFLWAQKEVRFPKGAGQPDKPQTVAVICLLTRLIFIWFIKEKGLVPEALFDPNTLKQLLREPPTAFPDASSYYKAILQNLFFATLNTEQNNRAWKPSAKGMNSHYLIHTFFRYRDLFKDSEQAFEFFSRVPFLNGGLFECLDREVTEHDRKYNQELEKMATKEGNGLVLRVDGFSDRLDRNAKQDPANALRVPNNLFFSLGENIDLNEELHTINRKREVRGLIPIFNRYKFTVEENTPLEEEVALDPELLGKVFENLLAFYNEDTSDQARKKSGSFYTPREVVDYIIDEALIAYFEAHLRRNAPNAEAEAEIDPDLVDRLKCLLAFDNHVHDFTEAEVATLTAAIEDLKALDPACGSGAFLMGMLQKLVHVLATLDPNNTLWKAQNRRPLERQLEQAQDFPDPNWRASRIEEAEDALKKLDIAFSDKHYADYSRKLFLIEKCLFGVDVEPIAVQIAKLRFFISLIVSQKADRNQLENNFNITALPNLETKLVAADSLLLIRPMQGELSDIQPEVDQKEAELRVANERHFAARSTQYKRKYREQIIQKRDELVELLKKEQPLTTKSANQMVSWNPFDQNASADFFDPEWMFGLRIGFDIVMGNPPYVRQEKIAKKDLLMSGIYECATGTADLYVYFYERSIKLLKPGGVFAFITSNKWYRSNYGANLRGWMQRNTILRSIIDFNAAPIFDALAFPTIVIATRRVPASPPAPQESAQVLLWDNVPQEIKDSKISFPEVFATEAFPLPQSSLKSTGWHLERPSQRGLLTRIRDSGTPLLQWCDRRMYRGITTGLNEAFTIPGERKQELLFEWPGSSDILFPCLRGRDVRRWYVEEADYWLIKIESSENKKHSWSGLPEADAWQVFSAEQPAIARYFCEWQDRLMARQDKGKYFWELRSCAFWEEFKQPKVFMPAIERRATYVPILEEMYGNNKTHFIATERWAYLASVLNSSISWWFTQQVFTTKAGGYYEFIPQFVGQIPIPDVHEDTLFSALVSVVLNKVQAPRYEQLLNGLIYELFFPAELHGAGIYLFDAAKTAGIEALAQLNGEALTRQIEQIAATVFRNDHPMFRMLFDLAGLEVVRTIEGRI